MPAKKFCHNFVTPIQLTSTTLPNGKRHYTLADGTSYPSITTILSELPRKGLDDWKKRLGDKEANRISGRAADRGTMLHDAVNSYLLNNQPIIDQPIVKSLFLQVKPTLNAVDNIRLMEQPLYSHRLRIAGKPDCIADWNKVFSVVDLKTSTRVKSDKYIGSYWCQVAAYAIMYEELYGQRPEQGVILVATEEAPIPSVFKKPISECFQLLKDYVKKLEEYRAKQKV